MDFALSDEQTLLQDSVTRFVANDYPFAVRQRFLREAPGFSKANWHTFARLGWLGIPLPEANGGFDGGSVDVMILMEQFGKGLVIEPYLATVVLVGGAIRIAGNLQQKNKYLTAIAGGRLQGALAFVEPGSHYNLASVSVTARKMKRRWVINGHKAVVLNGPMAEIFVVSARTSGERRDREGVSLFLVPADSAGVERRDYYTVDGHRASELYLHDAVVPTGAVLGQIGSGYTVLEQVIDEAIVAVGSEAVGAMEVLCKRTVEYCRTRKQFDQPLASFQVIQHRVVDMFMEYELAKSLMYMAAMRMDEVYGPKAQVAVSAFKVQLSESAKYVGQNAIQLHGAIGMTDELAIGHYFKRLTAIDLMFGDGDHHLRRYGAL